MRSSLRLVTLVLLLGAPGIVPAQIPRTLSYQGVLADNAGAPKPDGMYAFTFRLYNSSSGGSALWSETQLTQVQHGLFSVVLGSVTVFPASLQFNQPYWLSVQIPPDPESSSRTPLTAVGYAFSAIKADTAQYAVGTVSSGPIAVNTAGNAVVGNSTNGRGLWGTSQTFHAVVGETNAASMNGVWGKHDSANGSGVYGSSIAGYGVFGASNNIAVYGYSPNGLAVYGNSFQYGVKGLASGTNGSIGVWGEATANSADVRGVYGSSNSPAGNGIVGEAFATTGGCRGVWGISHSPSGVGVFGQNTDPNGWAGYFAGRTAVNALYINGGSDLAEPFDTETDVEPGTVLIIDEKNPGKLRRSDREYDQRVAGVASGAGGVHPGLTLRQDGMLDGACSVAIAGRVYCKAEALSGPIHPGDLLTTSRIAGHAMKATDKERAPGTIIGKAMTSLEQGEGLVLVLVNLQ